MVEKLLKTTTLPTRSSSCAPPSSCSINNNNNNNNLNCSSSTSTTSSSSSSTKKTLLDQHLEIAVQEAEKAFIRGDFGQALKDANRCLTYAQNQQQQQLQQQQHQNHHQNHSLSSSYSSQQSSQYYSNVNYRSFDREDHQDRHDESCYSFRINTNAPLYFPIVFGGGDNKSHNNSHHHSLYIGIDLSKPSDLVDRAAAVALQSWYELDRRMMTKKSLQELDDAAAPLLAREHHVRLLEPFWKTYSSDWSTNTNTAISTNTINNNPRSCSLELILVLIQFCQATSRVHEAMELAFATVDRMLSSQDYCMVLTDQRLAVQELVAHLLCNMLPYCTDTQAVAAGLKRFFDKRGGSSPSARREQERQQKEEGGEELEPQAVLLLEQDEWHLSDRINAAATRLVLRFLESPPVHWPEECKSALEMCQRRLEANVKRNYQHHHQVIVEGGDSDMNSKSANSCLDLDLVDLLDLEGPTLAVVPLSGRRGPCGRFSILPTLGWDGSLEQWTCRLIYLARQVAVEPLFFSEKRLENRTKLVVSIWSFWFAYRQRRRVYRGFTVALRMLVKPLQEIIEALLL